MAQALGLPQNAVVSALQGQIFFDPELGHYVTEDEYRSGNVRRKLRQAQVAAAMVDPQFEHNVRALEIVLPPRIMLHAGQAPS
ncbi:MAG: hypothetical protein HC853_00180 [Anaerolineae bacterium]|nr:hypothetical protein [Anaerolineae bacterium]